MKYNYIVIGAGAGGLVVAIGLAKAKKKVLLIEKGSWGGDCTNYGCIPSKTLIASSHILKNLLSSDSFGISLAKQRSTEGVLRHVQKIVSQVRSSEDGKALKSLGVDTLEASAKFLSPYQIEAIDKNQKRQVIDGKYFIIATGSTPFIPPIKGLKNTPFLTNETIFSLPFIPKSLAIIGAGPIGCELAQAFQRLGSKVFLIHRHNHILNKEELKAQKTLEKIFLEEGIKLFLSAKTRNITYKKQLFHIQGTAQKNPFSITAQACLIATGRKPSYQNLNLDKAKVQYTQKGISINSYCQTSQKHIYAVGDVTGQFLFTHFAEYQARTVLYNLLTPFFLRKKWNKRLVVPRVTYTDPEIASVGLSEREAKKLYGNTKITSYIIPLTEIDRAITENKTKGFIKIVTKKWSSQILGATITSPRAGEMLSEITLAMQQKIPLRKLSNLIHAYPTYSLGIRKAADLWLLKTILPIFKN